jgi:hypothetical protein
VPHPGPLHPGRGLQGDGALLTRWARKSVSGLGHPPKPTPTSGFESASSFVISGRRCGATGRPLEWTGEQQVVNGRVNSSGRDPAGQQRERKEWTRAGVGT